MMLFEAGLKLKLKPIIEIPPPETVNFAFRQPSGGLMVEKISLDELQKRTGQSFHWAETVWVPEDEKFPQTPPLPEIDQQQLLAWINEVQTNRQKLAIIKVNDVVGYGVIALEDLAPDTRVSFYAGLFHTRLLDIVKLSETSPLESLQNMSFSSPYVLVRQGSKLFCLNRITETVSEAGFTAEQLHLFDAELQPSFEVQSLLCRDNARIKPLLKQIEALQDDYGLAFNLTYALSAQNYRNYLAFMSHGMPIQNPLFWRPDEPCLKDFHPVNPLISQADWHRQLTVANVSYNNGVSTFNNVPFIFFKTDGAVAAGSLLNWHYGISFWLNRKIPPAILKLDGSIVEPATYNCKHSRHGQFFTPATAVTSATAPTIALAESKRRFSGGFFPNQPEQTTKTFSAGMTNSPVIPFL
ncbi:hypothetical protein ACFORL_08250 [Legionella dresdenensis]|uniref:Uncharacterized protein n=1 Tax=Legionella dresdenensis TaxID=450200 RepID=A0ABV8CFL8_9GAMM